MPARRAPELMRVCTDEECAGRILRCGRGSASLTRYAVIPCDPICAFPDRVVGQGLSRALGVGAACSSPAEGVKLIRPSHGFDQRARPRSGLSRTACCALSPQPSPRGQVGAHLGPAMGDESVPGPPPALARPPAVTPWPPGRCVRPSDRPANSRPTGLPRWPFLSRTASGLLWAPIGQPGLGGRARRGTPSRQARCKGSRDRTTTGGVGGRPDTRRRP